MNTQSTIPEDNLSENPSLEDLHAVISIKTDHETSHSPMSTECRLARLAKAMNMSLVDMHAVKHAFAIADTNCSGILGKDEIKKAAIELLKLIKRGKNLGAADEKFKVSYFRNSFLNLAVPSLMMSEPGDPVKHKIKDDLEVDTW
jgi:hypothetical protein